MISGRTDLISKELTVLNRAGIHARPAAEIAKRTSGFSSDIFFIKDSMKINAKSIMGIITLGATYRTRITCTCSGPDEEEAMKSIEDFFQAKFED